MVFNKLIEKVECMVEHDCAKQKSGRCAICEVGFHYISKNPLKTTCEHRICNNCCEKIGRLFYCKQHSVTMALLKDAESDKIINSKTKELFDVLKQDFEKTISLFEGAYCIFKR